MLRRRRKLNENADEEVHMSPNESMFGVICITPLRR